MTDETNPNRREFIKNTAIVAGVAVAPGIFLHSVSQAKPDEHPVDNSVRWGMLIDTNKCKSGCDDCVQACNAEHGLCTEPSHRAETQPQWIRKVELKHKQTGKQTALPMMCQHCENPPCQDVCPTGASFKREDGIVLVDKHICIGCRYCMMACPYKARSFVHETLTEQKPYSPRGKGTVESCTMCVHKVDKGELPACVTSCENGAIVFGDLNDPNSEIAQKLATEQSIALREGLKLNPSVRYQGV
ncbi:sulfate reduction electron transfer complex DsrMKJOP subunit DsrO [Candidatus Albibeggiatoa sp. nov. BB20]|uniref:sulfate reduction electron transfer complex DsrMKJOP subunit DsrO n=1 Tax=Candidatus Albibeggiatoa sp. nov. BB20 TaxID=3162723 RepID=UPI0033659D91